MAEAPRLNLVLPVSSLKRGKRNGTENLKLAVKNFGPIREGEVEFKPLTVFIGPNNSGKSYMAVLFYSLLQALIGKVGFPYGSKIIGPDLSDREVGELTAWVRKIIAASDIAEDNSAYGIHSILRNRLDTEKREMEVSVEDSFRDYFGCSSLTDLVSRNSTDFSVDVFYEGGYSPFLSAKVNIDDSQIEMNVEKDSLASRDVEFFRLVSSSEQDLFSLPFFSLITRKIWREDLVFRGDARGLCVLPPRWTIWPAPGLAISGFSRGGDDRGTHRRTEF